LQELYKGKRNEWVATNTVLEQLFCEEEEEEEEEVVVGNWQKRGFCTTTAFLSPSWDFQGIYATEEEEQSTVSVTSVNVVISRIRSFFVRDTGNPGCVKIGPPHHRILFLGLCTSLLLLLLLLSERVSNPLWALVLLYGGRPPMMPEEWWRRRIWRVSD
jgi:hypothetical protein